MNIERFKVLTSRVMLLGAAWNYLNDEGKKQTIKDTVVDCAELIDMLVKAAQRLEGVRAHEVSDE